MSLTETLTPQYLRPTSIDVTSDALTQFVQHLQRRRLAATTIRVRRDVLLGIERELDRPLLEATTEQLRLVLDARRLAPASICAYASHLHAFYEWAIDEDLIAKDPSRRIERPRQPSYRSRAIPKDEVAAALEATSGDALAWLLLGSKAGLRCCEVATIEARWIDYENRNLHVRGKGGKERDVPMHDEIAAALKACTLHPTGPAFRRPDGRPHHPDRLGRIIKGHLQALGINWTFHPFRHRFATDAYETSGYDLLLVSELLGHADPATTRVYVGINPERSRAAVMAL